MWTYYIIIVYLCIFYKFCIILHFHSTSMWPNLVFRIDRCTIYTGVVLNCLLLLHILINLLLLFIIINYIYLVCSCFVSCRIWSKCFTRPFIFDITSYIDISIKVNYYCLHCVSIIESENVAYALYVILVNISFITKHIKTIISMLNKKVKCNQCFRNFISRKLA